MSSIANAVDSSTPARARVGVTTHYLRYATGNVLVMIAGFVSFPIMTRLLDTSQYGIFGYFDAWLLILAGVFKLGAQHTILRFYPHTGGRSALARFGANHILAPFALSSALWILGVAAYAAIVLYAPPEATRVGWVMLLLLLPTMWISYVNAFAFAEERSDVSVRISVGQRWCETMCILLVVYFVARSTLGVYLARFGVASVFAIGLSFWLRRNVPLRTRYFDAAEFANGLRYGVPLVLNEIAATLLAFADRLMLRHLLVDFAAVGVYTIGYGLALNINNLFNLALYNAYTQVSIREFETNGAAAVLRTKRAVLHGLVYFGTAMIVGLVVAGPDALLLMAGNDKTASAPVFVLIGIVYTLDGMFGICGAGLLLLKRSRSVLALTLGAAVLNVLLNGLLIPRFGVMGSAYSSMLSFTALNLARYLTCPRELRALPDARATAIAVGLGILCIAIADVTRLGGVESHAGRIIMLALLLLVGFVAPAFTFDAELRAAALRHLASVRQRTHPVR